MKATEKAEKIWLEHGSYVRKFCEYKLQSYPHLVDDCVQGVFLVLLEDMRKEKEISYPKAYLTKVALNKINDIYKSEEKKKLTTLPFEDAYVRETTDFDYSLTEEFSEEEIEMHLQKILNTLSDSERKLLENFYIKKIRQKDLAREMKISENALRQQVFRLRRKIIKEIKKITT